MRQGRQTMAPMPSRAANRREWPLVDDSIGLFVRVCTHASDAEAASHRHVLVLATCSSGGGSHCRRSVDEGDVQELSHSTAATPVCARLLLLLRRRHHRRGGGCLISTSTASPRRSSNVRGSSRDASWVHQPRSCCNVLVEVLVSYVLIVIC